MSLSAIIILVLNIVFVVFVLLGFLFGLRGAKKSGLSLAFFIVSLAVTTLITPLITNLLLQINITVDGETLSVSQYIINMINEQPVIADLFNNGANIEQLVNNMPQLIGNLAVFIVLVYVVGFVFWIAYLITAHIMFKKKSAKNPISNSAPANVSATGTIKYIREERPKSKHRLLGGAVGALHGLILLVATLLPVVGAVTLFNDIANAQDVPASTLQVTLNTQGENSSGTSTENLTPSAKLLQENLPKEVLDITNAISNSVIGVVCEVVDVGDIWFNSLAKCEVDGKKIVLKNEIKNVAKVYDNVEFLTTLDFNNIEDVKDINFNKVRNAIGYIFDSNLLQAIVPDIINGVIDWLSVEDMETLDPQIQEFVKPLYDQIQKDDDLVTLFNEVKELFTNQQIMDTLEHEVLLVVDIAELIIQSDIIDELAKAEDEIDLTTILTELIENDYHLTFSVIDKVFESDFVNLGVLTAINMEIELLDDVLKQNTKDELEVDIPKLDIPNMVCSFETVVVKNIAKTMIDILTEYDVIGFENIEDDARKIVTENFDQNLRSIGKVIDSIYNMEILNEFDTVDRFIDALKVIEIEIDNDEETEVIKFTDYIDFNAINTLGFTFENEFYNLKGIKPLLAKAIVEEEDGKETITPLIMYVLNGDVSTALEQLTDDEINSIVDCLSNSKLLQPTSVLIINELNKQIQEVIGGDIAELLPEDIDLSIQSEEIGAVVSDVVTLLPELTDIQNGTQTLEDVIKNEEVQDTVVSLLENLETNANGEGVFTEVYDAMIDYIKDDSNGLTDIATIIENNTITNGTETNIDWSKVISDYLNSI